MNFRLNYHLPSSNYVERFFSNEALSESKDLLLECADTYHYPQLESRRVRVGSRSYQQGNVL